MRTTAVTIVFLALLAPAPARAVYQCGPLSDDCQCGGDNPYPCCNNGGNCTWFAWDSACCHWGIGLPGWGHAKTWAGFAESYPAVEVFTSPAPGCIACRIAPQFEGDIWGHVAWVTEVNGSQITVDEMACDSYYGMKSKPYSASYFEQYICLNGAVIVECGDGVCNGNEGCESCPQDCACAGFCQDKQNGLWCDGDDLVNCQGGQVASSTPCPCGCKSNVLGVNDECEPCGGGFCDGRADGSWCNDETLTHCQGGLAAGTEDCPMGCQPNPDEGEGHCVTPDPDTSPPADTWVPPADTWVPREDTHYSGDAAVPTGDLAEPVGDTRGAGDGDGAFIPEGEAEWVPGTHSSGCAAGPGGRSSLPWSLLLLALAAFGRGRTGVRTGV